MSLVQIENNQPVTSSLQVAESFKKRHSDVIRTIEDKLSSTQNCVQYQKMFLEDSYEDKSGKRNKMYLMNKDGWTFIAMGFTGKKADEFKLKYIEAFNNMEQELKAQYLPTSSRELAKLSLANTEEAHQRIDAIEDEVKDLKDNQKIAADDYGYISRRVNQRVSEVAKGFGKLTNEQRGKLFKDINTGIKQVTGVGSRSQIREKHYEMVVEFIQDWEPSTATKTIVRQMSLDSDDIA